MRPVREMFRAARLANLARHARNGTLVRHLVHKLWIRTVLRLFPF